MKDSTGDPERLLAELEVFPHPVYVGASTILLMAASLGLPGAILAVANVDPEHAIAAFAGDPAAQQALLPAHRRVRSCFPFGLKDAIADRFGTSRATRLG
jgi:4-hydroxy-tetrahydrodipicolinate synthase